ncbi:HesB/IscA family protein [Thiohalophilus thiocyanatoxydans]|uniref:Iron-sulfur cluster insertion protein n=1 Tax=Thiohalophilus thiocyanatoxydans TaxID=381308 RepID=A0A4R8ILN9_9GAMM|nr:iron-sulfur cluster assembly accessory protein [Thiohalophilus thiocyanatoxydans]TDY01044.1 iron-sulfur cluster insertion protein [Thiohalophilus thiocyanatoxydans]
MSQAMSFQPVIREQDISISDKAGAQLNAILQNADGGVEGIRIFVSGGGCGGMTYGMTYAENIDERDKVLEGDGYKVVVDAIALSYLKGSDIDYVEEGLNASFVFNNVFQSVGGSGACGACGGAA